MKPILCTAGYPGPKGALVARFNREACWHVDWRSWTFMLVVMDDDSGPRELTQDDIARLNRTHGSRFTALKSVASNYTVVLRAVGRGWLMAHGFAEDCVAIEMEELLR